MGGSGGKGWELPKFVDGRYTILSDRERRIRGGLGLGDEREEDEDEDERETRRGEKGGGIDDSQFGGTKVTSLRASIACSLTPSRLANHWEVALANSKRKSASPFDASLPSVHPPLKLT